MEQETLDFQYWDVSAATYGSSSAVPIITVDAKGRITSASTAAAGSGLTVTGDSGSEDINLLTESLAITNGETNVITTAASNGVDIGIESKDCSYKCKCNWCCNSNFIQYWRCWIGNSSQL